MSCLFIKLWYLALKSINKSSVVLTSTKKRYFNDLKSFTIQYIVKMSCLITSHLMKFNENQVYKQNEVSHWLVPITMIVTIDFRLFSESKSKKIQNVLFDNCCSRNYRMLPQQPGRVTNNKAMIDRMLICWRTFVLKRKDTLTTC